MKHWAAILASAVIAAGCSSTFLVSKDGKGYFFGSKSEAIYKMLCESGDLARVLKEAELPQEMKDSLYRYNCTPEQSGEKIKQIYASMTHDQRKGLRSAFRNNGYDINYLPC